MTPDHLDELERRAASLLDEEQYRRERVALPPTTWEHIGPRWFGRRVRVRWEEEPASLPATRPFPGGGRPIVRTGVIVATAIGWRVHTDDGTFEPPAFAHVVDLSSPDNPSAAR